MLDRCRAASLMRCQARTLIKLGNRAHLRVSQPRTRNLIGVPARCTHTYFHACLRQHASAAAAVITSATAMPAHRQEQPAAALPLDGFMQRIAECNCSPAAVAELVPFHIDVAGESSKPLGRLKPR